MMWFPWITVFSIVLDWTHARSAPTPASRPKAPTPLVDPGLFVIQGVSSCQNGTGYCMLGHNCEVDVDFLPVDTGGHCDGLKEAFTPRIHFICCKYNPNGGELTTTPAPTTIAPYTITDIFNIIDEQALQEEANGPVDYENYNPEDIIDIVGVVTDTTGVIGLVTRPWTGTFPTRSTTTPMPPTTSKSTTPMKTPTTDSSASEEKLSNEDATEEIIEPTEDYNKAPPTEPEIEFTTHEQDQHVTEPQVVTEKTRPVTETTVQQTISMIQNTMATSENNEASSWDNIVFPEKDVTTMNFFHSQKDKVSLITTESSINNEITNELDIDLYDIRRDNAALEETVGQNDMSSDYFDFDDDQLQLQHVNQNICGVKGYENPLGENSLSRIIGGVVATTVEWCWVAAIMERRSDGDKYVCTGAMIETNLLITTGTCLRRLSSENIGSYRIVLGDSNLQEDQPYGIQFHDIQEIITHPDYFTSGWAHANDIGLVRLRNHATLGRNVCLICMAQQDAVFPAQTCTVTGYGIGDVPSNVIREVRKEAPKEGLLRQLAVPLLEKSECQESLKNLTGSEILAMKDTFLCAGGLQNYSSCFSTLDGGSPLACQAGGRWFLAGLVSWSRDCTKPGVPNIYTRTSAFTDWVQSSQLGMHGFNSHQTPHASLEELFPSFG